MENEKKKESFIRWQGRQIEEFGKVINLLLGLSIATIGFVMAHSIDNEAFLSTCEVKMFILLGTSVLLLTTFLLLVLTLNRLHAIRLTAKIARQRETFKRNNIEYRRRCVRIMDNLSWFIFNLSIILFFIGQFFIIIGFIVRII